jgi:hypothetical protein
MTTSDPASTVVPSLPLSTKPPTPGLLLLEHADVASPADYTKPAPSASPTIAMRFLYMG